MRKFIAVLATGLMLGTGASAQMYAPGANVQILGDSGGTAQNGCVIALVAGAPVCSQKAALQGSSVVFNGGTAPTIAAGTGAGTSPTIAITGVENSQVVTLTTTCTVSCTGSAIVATVTLPLTCPTQAVPTITPGNLNAAQLSGSGQVYPTQTTNTYVLHSSSTGLVASTQYIWNVHVDCW